MLVLAPRRPLWAKQDPEEAAATSFCASLKSEEAFSRKHPADCLLGLTSHMPISKSVTSDRTDNTVVGLDQCGFKLGRAMGRAATLSTLWGGSLCGVYFLSILLYFVLNKSFLRKKPKV